MSLTLTFMHQAMWLPVVACVGLAALIAIAVTWTGDQLEPPAFFVALAWIGATLALAIANGVAEGFYNGSQIAFLLFGMVLGYLISISRPPQWAAWLPFVLFAAFFLGMIAMGRDPGEALTRNSRNFVSVIILALYASAVILSKATQVRYFHIAMALVTLVIAVAATGRGGIVATLALNISLWVNVILRGRMTFLRTLSSIAGVMIAAVAIYIGAGVMLSEGLFGRLAERGLQDAPRLAMIIAYFNEIEPIELFFGRNYYDDPFLARWDFNLHNSFLSAWAHLGVFYLMFILGTLALAAKRVRVEPVLAFAVGAFALRALTDTQMIAGKYDYLFVATLFILLRGPSPFRVPRRYSRSPLQAM